MEAFSVAAICMPDMIWLLQRFQPGEEIADLLIIEGFEETLRHEAAFQILAAADLVLWNALILHSHLAEDDRPRVLANKKSLLQRAIGHFHAIDAVAGFHRGIWC